MKYKYQYTTEEEKLTLISANTTETIKLVEEQNLFDGNFLIFEDVEIVPKDPAILVQQNLDIMQGMADIWAKLNGGV
jgi:hypothetical protein